MIRKTLTALAVAAALVTPTAPADAAQPRRTQLWAQMTDGSQFSTFGPRAGGVLERMNGQQVRLRPLRAEDGRRGYWLADYRGNGQGRSYVRVGGRTLYVSCWIVHPTRTMVANGACVDQIR